jgi:hypothetical protein
LARAARCTVHVCAARRCRLVSVRSDATNDAASLLCQCDADSGSSFRDLCALPRRAFSPVVLSAPGRASSPPLRHCRSRRWSSHRSSSSRRKRRCASETRSDDRRRGSRLSMKQTAKRRCQRAVSKQFVRPQRTQTDLESQIARSRLYPVICAHREKTREQNGSENQLRVQRRLLLARADDVHLLIAAESRRPARGWMKWYRCPINGMRPMRSA